MPNYQYWENQLFQSMIALGSPCTGTHSHPKFELLFKILEDYGFWENQVVPIYDWVATLKVSKNLNDFFKTSFLPKKQKKYHQDFCPLYIGQKS
jgi:hypothetical protein